MGCQRMLGERGKMPMAEEKRTRGMKGDGIAHEMSERDKITAK